MLEVVELAEECGEELIVGILLEGMVHEAETEHKLTGMLIAQIVFLCGILCECGKVMMTTEIEVKHFLNLSVYHLRYVYVVRELLFVMVAVHSIIIDDYEMTGVISDFRMKNRQSYAEVRPYSPFLTLINIPTSLPTIPLVSCSAFA